MISSRRCSCLVKTPKHKVLVWYICHGLTHCWWLSVCTGHQRSKYVCEFQRPVTHMHLFTGCCKTKSTLRALLLTMWWEGAFKCSPRELGQKSINMIFGLFRTMPCSPELICLHFMPLYILAYFSVFLYLNTLILLGNRYQSLWNCPPPKFGGMCLKYVLRFWITKQP